MLRIYFRREESPETAGAPHQLAFFAPGINPSRHMSRKQMRQSVNLRYTARGRPHNAHRRSARVVNLGFLLALAIFDLLAMNVSFRAAAAEAGSSRPGDSSFTWTDPS